MISSEEWKEPEAFDGMSEDYYRGFGHAACQAALLNSKTHDSKGEYKMSNECITIQVTKKQLMILVNGVRYHNNVCWSGEEDLELQEKLDELVEKEEI